MNRLYLSACVLLSILVSSYAGYRDRVHYSQTFQQNRNFRVITGSNFDSSGTTRYSVIYYCHGCLGSHVGDQYDSYVTNGGYTPSFCSTGCVYPYTKPYNADFQAFTNDNNVIVVMVDGRVSGTSGCGVWIPYNLVNGWTGNEYRFGKYLRELFSVVDSLYPTRAIPQHRAISGLSMGGAASLWLAAQNQHLLRSMSTFCHSPSYVKIGGPSFTTYVDVTQLWRNFRGLSTRVTSNAGDYIYGMSWNLSQNLDGASLRHEYHRTDFDRHWAYHIDSQFNFHVATFQENRVEQACFSVVNIYPDFDAWGWDITSNKGDSGWIYLKDATKSGFGLLTRKWLPFGTPLSQFPVTVRTAPYYEPNGQYSLLSYNYRTGGFTSSSVSADANGRITVVAPGGMGNEYGISGNGLSAHLAMLVDTLMESMYIVSGKDTAISGAIVNLSQQNLSNATVKIESRSSLFLVSKSQASLGSFPAGTIKRMDSIAVLRGTIDPSDDEVTATGIPVADKRTGFISVKYGGSGVDTTKEQLIQVNLIDTIIDIDSSNIRVLDGRTESFSVFRANRFGQKNYFETKIITEGIGNGNGKIDSGEVFSFWFRLYNGLDSKDTVSWHPVVPVSGMNMPGIVYKRCKLYEFDVIRHLMSAEMECTRKPTLQEPMEIIFKAVSMRAYPATGSIRVSEGRSMQQDRYYRVRLPLSLSISAEKLAMVDNDRKNSLFVHPNPFNPVTTITFSVAEHVNNDKVVVQIMDTRGKIIRRMNNGNIAKSGNTYRFIWDGTDMTGKRAGAGIYIVRVSGASVVLAVNAILMP